MPNPEARRAYDHRVERLRAALGAGDREALALGLCEARLLGLWRARAITGFDAFAADVLGLSPEEARTLSEEGRARLGLERKPLPDTLAALWLRAEITLRRHCPDARVRVVGGTPPRLALELPLETPQAAVEAMAALGRRADALGHLLVDVRGPRVPRRRRDSSD